MTTRRSNDPKSSEVTETPEVPQQLKPVDSEPQGTEKPSQDQPDPLSQIEQLLSNNSKQFLASSVSDDRPVKLDSLTREDANKIISLYSQKSDTGIKEAMIGITALVQAGGTNSSIPPFTRTINGTKFDLKTLRETVAFVTDKKGTVRQLAKTLRDNIYKIAVENSWLGPLAKSLQTEYPDKKFSPTDLVGAAEFHEDNLSSYITEDLRAALRDRSQKMQALRAQKPSQKKQGKKGNKNKKKNSLPTKRKENNSKQSN